MGETRGRKDGRRQLLIYLQPEIVKELKKAAVDQERPVYRIAEEALTLWLKRASGTKSKGSQD